MQRKQLDAVHQDSAKELGFAARTRIEELSLARLTNDPLLEAYLKVGKNDQTASDKEIHKFIVFMRLSYLQLINAWNLGGNNKNIEYCKGSFGNLMRTPGERKYYLTNGRIIIKTVFG